ncbi:hypothetical protein Bcep1808_7084 (plasmid) [Burkholderia vietnamiensis G4]|uniref:Uncharacterized protein n=1 Tax=Burkholderia vietnamiensis (strain G4 / LMG 22486) TaxID=269482 RepID=A4JUL4_BURVG|nr:hypothetical protein Bcep1808_7084 [Burkholderia vietnamiensis G4]
MATSGFLREAAFFCSVARDKQREPEEELEDAPHPAGPKRSDRTNEEKQGGKIAGATVVHESTSGKDQRIRQDEKKAAQDKRKGAEPARHGG